MRSPRKARAFALVRTVVAVSTKAAGRVREEVRDRRDREEVRDRHDREEVRDRRDPGVVHVHRDPGAVRVHRRSAEDRD